MKPQYLTVLVLSLLIGISSTIAQAELVRPLVGEDVEYTTKEGDTLLSIAQEHRVAIEHLAFANGYPTNVARILPETSLRIPARRVLPKNPPKNGLVLNIPERGIFRFADGQFQDFFPVSVGNPPDALTPIGSFHIIEKVVNPTWYPPSWAESQVPVPPGPDNPLGDRWIGLSAHLVGIHGTNNPVNVGGSVTHGCIRCYPNEIRDLFTKVEVGLPVRIEYETAKLGKGSNGELYLVTFPDVYSRSNPNSLSTKILDKVGLGSLMNDRNFAAKVELTLGMTLDLNREKERVHEMKKLGISGLSLLKETSEPTR